MAQSLNAADSVPSFKLIQVGFYSGSGVPSFTASTTTALFFRTDGSSNATRMYVTLNAGTSWVAVTTAS